MTQTATETRSVVIEREIAHSPEKIWRALTRPHLIEEWLMKNDFHPAVGHKFNLRGGWGAVDCQVLQVEPHKTLSYTWAAYGLESVVTWTLTPTSKGANCAWSSGAFGRIRSSSTRELRLAGGTSSPSSRRFWGGWTEARSRPLVHSRRRPRLPVRRSMLTTPIPAASARPLGRAA